MKKIIITFMLLLTVLIISSCSKSTSGNINSNNGVKASSKYIDDIDLISYNNSGNTVYFKQKAILSRSVKNFSQLQIYVKGTYKIKLYFTNGSSYNTTLNSSFIIRGTLTASSQVFINTSYEVESIAAVNASYIITSVDGILYL